MGFKHDYSGVKEFGEGFEPIPEGDYNFVITKTEERMSKNKNPMVHVTCKVLDGTNAGRLVWYNVNFLPKDNKAAGMSKHFLHVIGQPYEGNVMVNCEDWVDAEFRAHVKVDEFNGKPQNDIDEVYDAEVTKSLNSEGQSLAGESDDDTQVPF